MKESNTTDISVSRLRPDVKVVVLDLDGTLYDKHGLARRLVWGDLLELSFIVRERRARKEMRGQWYGNSEMFNKTFFANMVKGSPWTSSFIRWWYHTCYMPMMVRIIRKRYHPRGWVIDFVSACRQMGVGVVVLSDYSHTEEKLQALGLDVQLFDWVVSAPELGGLKPAKELMVAVAEKVGVAPSQCVVIGDREDTDGAMARAVGAEFWLVK